MARFNSDNAREMAARSHEAKRQRLESLRQAVDDACNSPATDYTSRRLARVRVQLDQVDQRIAEESAKSTPNGQLLNWLCAAQERLSDQEFALANRPKPGMLRPTAPKAPRRAYASQPLPPNWESTPDAAKQEPQGNASEPQPDACSEENQTQAITPPAPPKPAQPQTPAPRPPQYNGLPPGTFINPEGKLRPVAG